MMRLGVLDEIREAVLERGGLSKEEIIESWGLNEEDYRAVHGTLCGKAGFESGPRRVGGIRRRDGRAREDAEPTFSLEQFALSSWEAAAVDRLVELLDFKKLEELLGELRYTLRQARTRETGEDRRGTKEELARALVVQHGIDVLADTGIRHAVAAALRIQAPGRWHPGKAGAREFVALAGMPTELAGLPSPDTEPDFEYLEGRFRLEPLQPFQREVQRGLLETLQEPLGRRCIVTLPTGGGKTRVAVESLAYWFVDRFDRKRNRADHGAVLWLAHTEELCEQAASCFRQVWEATDNVCPLTMVRFWGPYTRNLFEYHSPLATALTSATVLISTPQRVSNLIEEAMPGAKEVLDHLERALGLIVIDEAHRAAAPMYRRIVTRLAEGENRPSLVGLTATPFRKEYDPNDPESGTRELRAIFHRLVEPTTLGDNPRLTLQGMQILAEPEFEEVETATAIRIPDALSGKNPSEEEIEKIDRVLATRTDNTPRRFLALERMLELACESEASILYFGPSVHDAECMGFLLRQRGVRAAVVSGGTRDSSRRQAIQAFKRGEVQILCNCEVLTTGFDAPRVTHVVVARPTVSQVLYEQMIGRGLRGPRFGGTAKCGVVNLRDEYRGRIPELGYERFRELWYGKGAPRPPRFEPRIASAPTPQEAPVARLATAAAPEQPLRQPLPSGLSQPTLDPAEEVGWPELWEELLLWKETNGGAMRWEREVLDKMAQYMRNSWPVDARAKELAKRLKADALALGFRVRAGRPPQGQLFS